MDSPPNAVPLLLQRVPDGRRASLPLLSPVFFPYAALMLGPAVAGACALYNAVALRRGGLAVVAVVLGLLGWVGFGFVVAAAVAGGLENGLLALLPARLLNVGFGTLLAWSQWGHVRGHQFLDGKAVPLLHAVLVAFAAIFIIPLRARLLLEGLWPLLYQ